MAQQNYAFGPFVFDIQRKILSRQGSTVAMGHKCIILLETLLRAEGRAVSKSALMIAAWQTENIEESNLAVQIAALRKCLGRSKRGEDWIATVQRVGYQFVNRRDAPVLLTEDRDAAANLTADERPSIAVLPFANVGGDPEQAYFSDGVTEDIIIELARWRLLSVRSRSASFSLRSETVDIRHIAGELNVRYIVEGSVRRIGKRLRINVQLIDAVTNNEVWAEKYDREAEELFELRDQLVSTIVSTLVGRVQVAAFERVRRKPPASLLAYECVLRGNALPWSSDPMARIEATRLFARAIEIDPYYSQAHSLLAHMCMMRWHDDPSKSDAALQEAFDLANRAVQLDSSESAAFATLAIVCLKRRSFDLALQHIHRAIELNPNNQWNRADLGVILTNVGESEAALECFKRARAIDPYFDPPWYWWGMGEAYMVLHRHEEALYAFEHVVTRDYRVAALMAACHARLENKERALAFTAECLTSRRDFSISHLIQKQPFKYPTDAAWLAESLRMAGLPE
jgi:TolB-like protein/Tfp pilus assembly protein PilF